MKIRKLPSGNYNAQVFLGRKDGKKIVKSVTSPDKAAVRRMVSEIEKKKDKPDPPTLGECLDAYVKAKKAVLSPYTVKGYENIVEKVKDAGDGDVAADMTAPEAQRIVNSFAGLSPKTVRNRVGLISAALKFSGYTFPHVTLPQKEKVATHVPTEEEMKVVMEAAAGTELEVPIALGALGLRRGEICGLTLSDLDGNSLHIHRAAVDIGGKVTVKSPKTYDSDRVVTVPEALADKMRSQGYVTLLAPEQLSYHFITFLKRIDVPHFRFHDLRHFFASYCHNVLHLSDAQIQKLGGWKTDHVMKKIYITSMEDQLAADAAAAGIAQIMG